MQQLKLEQMEENTQIKVDSKQVVITENNAGQRIDNFLIRYFGKIPNSRIYQMLRKGEVRVNKRRTRQSYKLEVNDVVRIPPVYISEKQTFTPNQSIQKKILNSIIFEDEGLIAINKPPGIVVHGGSKQSYGVIEIFRALNDDYRSLELVHRLDKDTSGCIILAKGIPILRNLQEILRDRKTVKTYLALLSGSFTESEKIINKPLRKNIIRSGERVVTIDKNGKSASTIFYRKRLFNDATLDKNELLTGRTHQIRVHSASMGNFVIGDKKYGDKAVNLKFKKMGLSRMFLHSESLNFISPITKKRTIIKAPMEKSLVNFLEKLD